MAKSAARSKRPTIWMLCALVAVLFGDPGTGRARSADSVPTAPTALDGHAKHYAEAAPPTTDPTASTSTGAPDSLSLIRTLVESGDLGEALRRLETLCASRPNHVEAALLLARLYERTGDDAGVLRALRPLAQRTDNADVEVQLGRACLRLGRRMEATRYLREAVRADPRHAEAHGLLGVCLADQNKPALASRYLMEALRLGLDRPAIHLALAACLHQLGRDVVSPRVVEAIGGDAGVIRGDVLLVEPVPGQAGSFRACGAGSALYHVMKARLDGSDSSACERLCGDISLALGRFGAAVEAYEQCCCLAGDSSVRCEGVIEFDGRANWARPLDRGEIGADVRTGADGTPVSPNPGPPVTADTDPLSAEFYANYARALEGCGRIDAGLSQWAKASRLSQATYRTDYARACLRAAQQYAAEANRVEYARCLQTAVNNGIDDARTRYALGKAYVELDREVDAARQWQRVLEINPRHSDRATMLDLIARVQQASGYRHSPK